MKSDSDRPIRFAVRSLGWVEIAEEDLTPERSSKAVNKCIVDLALGRNDLLDVVGRWGDVSSNSMLTVYAWKLMVCMIAHFSVAGQRLIYGFRRRCFKTNRSGKFDNT